MAGEQINISTALHLLLLVSFCVATDLDMDEGTEQFSWGSKFLRDAVEIEEVPQNISINISVYCDPSMPFYCPNHIACRRKSATLCGNTKILPPPVANVIALVHNECRERATRAYPYEAPAHSIRGYRLGEMPPSAAFMRMTWDEELSALASLWVVSCAVDQEAHALDTSFGDEPPEAQKGAYMKLVYAGEKKRKNMTKFCFDVSRFDVNGWMVIRHGPAGNSEIMMWRDELWQFCAEASRTIPDYVIETYREPTHTLGTHFSREGACMLWAHAARVGCGYREPVSDDSASLEFSVIACLYGPAPLHVGQRIYEVGPQGSACPPLAPATNARWPHLCQGEKEWTMTAPIAVPVSVALALATAVYCVAKRF